MSEARATGAAPSAPARAGSVGLLALAGAFFKIAMASLGGGLSAWALRVLVEERGWLTEEEFLSALTICRILPGPNQVNMAVYVGTRFRGLPGAAAALAGLTLVPLAIALGLGVLYFGHRRTPGLQAIMTGLVAAAAGMTLSVGVKLSFSYLRRPVALALAVAAFVGVAVMRWPLLLVLAALGPVGIAWYWPRSQGQRAVEPAA
ncbi:MAG TPA: chromate transporter [Candidatus Methylomirabilis sp.]|nr:chromate transporter [Candidatus Methylomirabilis sp.]